MVDVIGRAKVIVESAIDRSTIDQTGGKIGAGLKKGALIGVAALGTLTVAGVKAFQAFEEAEAQGRKLTQVLDNMGESKASPAVQKLADDLRKLTGVDDEVIKGGQTVLATFSEVAASAGDVGGVFERATRASLDLAAVLKTDVQSASVQLGKALQDPILGITALRKAGVTFTADQKKVIEQLVATGDVAEAQRVILAEVEKQVGGTAEAGATESAKISSAMGEIQETLGAFVADLVSDGEDVDSFSESLEKLNDELIELKESEGWAGIREAIRGVGHAIGFVIGFLEDWSAFWEDVGGETREGVEALTIGFTSITKGVSSVVSSVRGAAKRIKAAVPDWVDAGGKLIAGLIRGMASGGIPGVLADKIIDAINKALPDEITFFGGKGGVPAITVPIPQLATGTRNFAGGLALVGENGPELVNLPTGSDVHNNSETQRILSGAGTSGDTINYWQFYGPESLSQARQQEDWSRRYGTRFGSAGRAVAL